MRYRISLWAAAAEKSKYRRGDEEEEAIDLC
jgi:hypothetical protein